MTDIICDKCDVPAKYVILDCYGEQDNSVPVCTVCMSLFSEGGITNALGNTDLNNSATLIFPAEICTYCDAVITGSLITDSHLIATNPIMWFNAAGQIHIHKATIGSL